MHKSTPLDRRERASKNQQYAPSAVRHSICALASLGGVTILILVFITLLFRLTQQFGMFSTTVLVFGLTTLWVLVWISLESVWEWRAGRLFR